MGVPQGEASDSGGEVVIKKTMAENSPDLKQNVSLQTKIIKSPKQD